MSDNSSTAQKAWVARVLGVEPPGGKTGKTGTTGLSVVRLGKARVQFIEAQRRAVAAIGQLRETLRAQFADDTEQQTQLSKADGVLAGLATALDSALNDELDAVLNEADTVKRQALAESTRATLQRLTGVVTGNPIMSELDGNEVMPQMQVTAPLVAGLQAIAAALG
jgi:hypothetical protein